MTTTRDMIATGKIKTGTSVIAMITGEMKIIKTRDGKIAVTEMAIATSIHPAIMETGVIIITIKTAKIMEIKTGEVTIGTRAMKTGILTGIGNRETMDQIPVIIIATGIGGTAHQMK